MATLEQQEQQPWAEQTFETSTTITTLEVKTMSNEVFEDVATVATGVVTDVASEVGVIKEAIEMRHNTKENPVESALQRHFSQQVVDLIYWRDIKKSAAVVSSSLLLLISLSIFSVLSVISYMSLAVLTVTFSFSVYKRTLAAVQKSNEGHPFSQVLEMDLSIPPEKAQQYAEVLSSYTATYVGELRRLVLVEDMVDSIKFGIFLWVMTYVGSWFNGLTLLILGFVGMFSLPKTYEVYQDQIDAYVSLAQDQVKAAMAQIKAKLPGTWEETQTKIINYYNQIVKVLRAQLPNNFEEAKEKTVKVYNQLLAMIQAKIPIGKKDQ